MESSYLPVELIQHIQSFLGSLKEACKTCVISKSWHAAWCTRSLLVFDERHFVREGQIMASNQFSTFCRKEIDRYKELNTYVDTLIFRLDLHLISSIDRIKSHDLINDAVKLEPNKLSLTLFHDLPSQVFATTSLTQLHLQSCNLFHTRPLCSRLTTLSLECCSVSNLMVAEILRGCPLIENLYLVSIPELRTVNVSNMPKLVNFTVVFEFPLSNIVVDATEFRYLRQLSLEQLIILDNEFFTKFSSKFPFIEDLILKDLACCENIQIISHSLRYLSVCNIEALKKMQFYVPNISKFVFKAHSYIPFLSFGTTASRDWESEIELNVEESGFLDLKEFLTKLSQSRISLCIRLKGSGAAYISVGHVPCFPIPMVEDLTVSLHINPRLLRDLFSSCRRPSFILDLFSSCRPSFILSSSTSEDLFQRLIYKQVIQQHDNKDLFSMYNLEAVNLELFDRNLNEWQTTPSRELIDAPEIPNAGKPVRFRLSWGAGRITV